MVKVPAGGCSPELLLQRRRERFSSIPLPVPRVVIDEVLDREAGNVCWRQKDRHEHGNW